MVNHLGVRFRWTGELFDATWRLRQEIPKIQFPFLVATGTKDLIVDWTGSQYLYENASSPDKDLKTYEGLYHEILNEPEREVLIIIVQSHVSKCCEI